MVKVVSQEQKAELKRLFADLQQSLDRQKVVVEMDGPLEGEALARLQPEREKAISILGRVNEILGERGLEPGPC